jgi:hypothetical protein
VDITASMQSTGPAQDKIPTKSLADIRYNRFA